MYMFILFTIFTPKVGWAMQSQENVYTLYKIFLTNISCKHTKATLFMTIFWFANTPVKSLVKTGNKWTVANYSV